MILGCQISAANNSSGFDSVPAEFGLMFNSRQWVSPAVPNRVDAYLSLESDKRIVGNFGTFESAVYGVANVNQLTELRQSRPKRARPHIAGPGPVKGSTIEHQQELGLWAVKLPLADAIVVRRTLSTLTENPSGLQGVNEDAKHAEKRAAFWSTVKPAHFGVKISTKSLLVLGCQISAANNSSVGQNRSRRDVDRDSMTTSTVIII